MQALWWLLAAAQAEVPGSEIVVILDNSCSMAAESGFNNARVPANDPERLAVLGAQIVADLGLAGDDEVTVLGFGETATSPPAVADSGAALRGWPYTGGTFFRSPLTRAEQILRESQRSDKLLLFLTDGVPSPEDNIRTPADLRAIFSPAAHPDVTVLPIGVFNHPDVREVGTALLGAISRSPDDVSAVSDAGAVVDAFTVGFARAIGSRPETGTLSGGGRQKVTVGRYVSEVLAVTVSQQPGPAFSASLESPAGTIQPLGTGDNGCTQDVASHVPPEVCADPRRHYQVFRATNDPDRKTEWSLSIGSGAPEVKYGIILRYDLSAGLDVPATVAAGTEVPVKARLIFRGDTFDDAEFFSGDNFRVTAKIGDETVSLTHAGGGMFTGTWTPADDSDASRQAIAEVVFENDWMQKSATQPLTITPPPYSVMLTGPLDLAPVPSLWKTSKLCGTLSLAGSKSIDSVELNCTVDGGPMSVGFTCERSGPEELTVCAETRRWCCGPTGEVTVTAAGPNGKPPRTADSEPVTFTVDNPGFLRCYWLPISLALFTAFMGWFIYGWVRPYRFDPNATVTLAGSEKGLRRATPQNLEECPGGKRGFYRNARLCINGAGDMVKKPKQAALIVEASKNQTSIFKKAAGIEQRDRRTRKWELLTPEDLGDGFIPGTLYRMGDLYIKFD